MRLNEVQQSQWETVVSKIRKSCAPYLSQTKLPVYRGMVTNKDTLVHKMRIDRQPLDTNKKVHDAFDLEFTDHFGWPYRSMAVFATGDASIAAGYANKGDLVIMIPMGNFNFLWSPVYEDMFAVSHRVDEDDEENFQADVEYYVEQGKYTDKNLDAAVRSENEIMFACHNGYLALSARAIVALGGTKVDPNLSRAERDEFEGEENSLRIIGEKATLEKAWADIIG
jgi:hypothetical protein